MKGIHSIKFIYLFSIFNNKKEGRDIFGKARAFPPNHNSFTTNNRWRSYYWFNLSPLLTQLFYTSIIIFRYKKQSFVIKGGKLLSSFDHLVKDVLATISSLRNFFFSHTVRQGNVSVQALAQRTRLSFSLLVWIEFVHLDLDLVVAADFPAR